MHLPGRPVGGGTVAMLLSLRNATWASVRKAVFLEHEELIYDV